MPLSYWDWLETARPLVLAQQQPLTAGTLRSNVQLPFANTFFSLSAGLEVPHEKLSGDCRIAVDVVNRGRAKSTAGGYLCELQFRTPKPASPAQRAGPSRAGDSETQRVARPSRATSVWARQSPAVRNQLSSEKRI